MRPALLTFLVCTSYLLFAGGPRWTAIPLLAQTAITLLVATWRRPVFPSSFRALDWSLGAVLLAMTFQ
ncbi:MAG TPA: hypothetical protein VEA16_12230, partial [Vicinamibacterales bacterium]|nr:hypothetical protein [Vicinamibacterales bacterium]